jgi:hypothetical protein
MHTSLDTLSMSRSHTSKMYVPRPFSDKSIDGIVVDTVSNNLMFDHDGLALSGVLPLASITLCLACSTGSFLTTHDVPYDHGKYEQDVTKAGPPYLCKSTPDGVDAIVVADDEASNLIGNVADCPWDTRLSLGHSTVLPHIILTSPTRSLPNPSICS